jgi:hypothetical protein
VKTGTGPPGSERAVFRFVHVLKFVKLGTGAPHRERARCFPSVSRSLSSLSPHVLKFVKVGTGATRRERAVFRLRLSLSLSLLVGVESKACGKGELIGHSIPIISRRNSAEKPHKCRHINAHPPPTASSRFFLALNQL